MGLDLFTSNDICKIIKECAKSGVSELKLGDFINVQFDHKAHLDESALPEKAIQDKPRVFPPTEPHLEAEIEETALIQDKSERINDELDEMLLSNPAEFEDMMANRELEDAKANIS